MEGAQGDQKQRESRREEARGCLRGLAPHSFWFDMWVFLLFDLVLFIFIYLLPL